MNIVDLNIITEKLTSIEKSRQSKEYNFRRLYMRDSKIVTMSIDGTSTTSSCRLNKFIEIAIENSWEIIIEEALRLEEVHYQKVLKATKEASLEFATGMKVTI